MNYEVKELLGFDVYRDGGSISASFGDSEGTLHELMFVIDNIASERIAGVTIYKSAYVNLYDDFFMSIVEGDNSLLN